MSQFRVRRPTPINCRSLTRTTLNYYSTLPRQSLHAEAMAREEQDTVFSGNLLFIHEVTR